MVNLLLMLGNFNNSRITIFYTVRGESVSADMKAAEEFLETVVKLIVEGSHLPEQIFNMDKTS